MTGGEIRQFRQLRGWSQQRMASEMGVSISTLCNWERNKNKPSYDHLKRLMALRDAHAEA